MPDRSRVPAAAVAVVAVVVLGTSCSAGPPDEPGSARPAATTSEPVTSPGLPVDQVGQAHRAALGLLALGPLGAEKASRSELRAFAARTTLDGRSLDEQIRALATTHGLALGDDVGAATQGVLVDLKTRSGRPFDQAWLQAVSDLVVQGQEATDAVRSSPTTSEQAASVARNLRSRLDALATALQRLVARVGAGTPTR